ncbi:MAG: leucyl aminopeptidase [Planctomycetes bacterium]|nr:leucyl aminopeptidase [Planctomycetota bacterium]
MTRVQLKANDPAQEKLDLLAVLAFEGDKPEAAIDELTGGKAARAVRLGDFKGKARQTALFYGEDGKVARVLLVGLGPRKGATVERVRRAAGAAAGEARRLEVRRLGLALPATLPAGLHQAEVAAAAAEAAVLADYAYDRFKGQAGGEPKKPRPELAVEVFAGKDAQAAVDRAVAVAQGANLARDLANGPANHMTPTLLASAAREAGRTHGFKVKVLDPDEMKRLGMGALLAVAQGSHEPARFIHMEHAPKGKAKPKGGTVVVVGKGITFDTGGISIKPADKMWEMKFDKAGGCAVVGLMAALASAGLPARVIGLVPATENMPGGAAVKPGDVVRALNGKSIEILNTDAEGRLILADALAYAARFKPDVVIDMATLTGAVLVALGDVRAAVLSTDDALADALRAAGDATGELLWPLPMDDAYGEHVKGEVADVKNLGKGREAGTIAGAWFLRHFVPEGAAWAHLDIAGTAWASGDPGKGYLGKGASGFGVRLLFEYLRARCEG